MKEREQEKSRSPEENRKVWKKRNVEIKNVERQNKNASKRTWKRFKGNGRRRRC